MNDKDDDMNKLEVIDIEEIKRLIPHRYPFLLIDFVKAITLGKSAIGIKNVTINEPFFPGHFPKEPIMPGVLIVEALAQTAAVLVVKTINQADEDLLVYFMSMNNTKFRKLVRPGDTLSLKVEVIQNRRNVWRFCGTALVSNEIAAESEFTAMMVKPD